MNNKKEAKAYLKELLARGAKEIKITWEGGNDEGSFNLYVDDEHINVDWNKKDGAYQLVDFIAEEIDYGSFAGDFFVNGEVVYDVEQRAFVGTDDCETVVDSVYKFKEPLVLPILKDLWFDSVSVELSGYEEEVDASVRLSVVNGPVVEEHVNFETNAVKVLENKVSQVFLDVDEVRDVWIGKDFSKDDLDVDEEGNFLVVIKEINYNKYEGEFKEVTIQL